MFVYIVDDDIRLYAGFQPGVWTRDSTSVSGQPQPCCVNSRLINPSTLVLLSSYSLSYLNIYYRYRLVLY